MNIAFIGAGSYLHLGIIRSMIDQGVFAAGEIRLHDLARPRAELMARWIAAAPEYQRNPCPVRVTHELPDALDGADAVTVVLMAGSQQSYHAGTEPSLRHGFISTDNLSVNGAFLAAKGVPIVLNIAREMERRCPSATLLDFANPVGVLAGAVNRHTRIRAFGVCAGYTNHLWDIARYFGTDEMAPDCDVDCVGVNHMSFIVRGTLNGQDLFAALDRRFADPAFKLPPLRGWTPEATARNHRALLLLRDLYLQYGLLVFSSEPDGAAHFRYDDEVAEARAETVRNADAAIARHAEGRRRAEESFAALLDRAADPAFWDENQQPDGRFYRQDRNIFVKIMTGLARIRPVKVAASAPNRGAILDLPDDYSCEYAFHLYGDRQTPAGTYRLPPAAAGITAGMAAHQNQLADALATEDPRLFAQALMMYPLKSHSRELAALCRELLAVNAHEIAEPLARHTADHLPHKGTPA